MTTPVIGMRVSHGLFGVGTVESTFDKLLTVRYDDPSRLGVYDVTRFDDYLTVIVDARSAVVEPVYEFEPRWRVLGDIEHERAAQDAKWGEQHWPDGTDASYAVHADGARELCNLAAAEGRLTWRHILNEEHYEALAETDPAKLRVELIQIAAVAAAWAEDIDSRDDVERIEYVTADGTITPAGMAWANGDLDDETPHPEPTC